MESDYLDNLWLNFYFLLHLIKYLVIFLIEQLIVVKHSIVLMFCVFKHLALSMSQEILDISSVVASVSLNDSAESVWFSIFKLTFVQVIIILVEEPANSVRLVELVDLAMVVVDRSWYLTITA